MSDSYPTKGDAAGPGTPQSAPAGTSLPVTIQSATLLQGGREVTIVHGSESYRLRLTRMNKLILTK